jgi:hypothetical protein
MREHIRAFLQRDASRGRYRKRMMVLVCAVVNLGVTLYIVHVLLATALLQRPASPTSSVFRLAAPPSSSQLVNYMRSSWHSSRYGARTSFTKLQQMIAKSGIKARLGSLPLKLMHRVKEIELETAAALAKQASAKPGADDSKTQDEEEQQVQELLGLRKQAEVETAVREQQQGVPAVEDDEQGAIERLDLPPECHPEPNSDFGGAAVRWGLTHHTDTAADCCRACLWQAQGLLQRAAAGGHNELKCNVWVFCPEKDGCVSPDAYKHKYGECWLKQADQPRAIVQNYSELPGMNASSPLPVLWLSGVVTPA